MNQRWYIFKDHQALGPFTPEEIRASLRDGTFDPFDLVAREGSSVRRELVEVDELFLTSKVVYGEDSPALAFEPPSDLDGAGGHVPDMGGMQGGAADGTRSSGRSADMIAGKGHLALAQDRRETLHSATPNQGSGSPAGATPPRKRRRDPKHFQLLDGRGRLLGPMSASEIQALFYKGVIDRSVSVMRNGSRAKVPVQRFVAIYSEAKGQRPPMQGAHPVVGGLPRLPAPRIRLRSRASGLSSVTIFVLIAALVFGAAAIYVVHQSSGGRWLARLGEMVGPGASDNPASRSRPRKPKRAPRKKPLRPGGRLPRAAAPTDDSQKPLQGPLPRAEKTPRQKPAVDRPDQSQEIREIREVREARRQEQLAAEKRRRQQLLLQQQKLRAAALAARSLKLKAAKAAAASHSLTPKPPKASLAQGPKVKPGFKTAFPQGGKPLPVAAPAPAPAPAPPKPQGPTVGALVDGQQVTRLGPMTFDKNAVNACEGGCNVVFTGAGGSVKGAFFKQIFGPELLKRHGGVYLSGLVRKDGATVKIILSNVQ